MTEKKFLTLSKSYFTVQGEEIKTPVVAYEEYGIPDGPVVLLCHGGLSNQHAADVTEVDPNPGWWGKLVGPGNVFDTDKFRILSLNALGSIAGTSSAITVNPDTGESYGKDFPYVSMEDMARFTKQALEELGVKKVFWAAGLSMGSLMLLNMAVLFPEFVGAITPVATAPYMTSGGIAIHNVFINSIRNTPGWKKGEMDSFDVRNAIMVMSQMSKVYYTHYALYENMTEGNNDQLAKEQQLSEYLMAGMEVYADGHDANCVIACLRACNSYSIANGFGSFEEAYKRLSMPALVISINTDPEFPPHYGKELADGINAQHPGNAEYTVIESIYGHLGCVLEGEKLRTAMLPFKEKLLNI